MASCEYPITSLNRVLLQLSYPTMQLAVPACKNKRPRFFHFSQNHYFVDMLVWNPLDNSAPPPP